MAYDISTYGSLSGAISTALSNPLGGLVTASAGLYPQAANPKYFPAKFQSLRLKGEGAGMTVIQGGLEVDFPSTGQFCDGNIGTEDISFITNTPNGGTALALVSTTNPGVGPIKDIKNTSFSGAQPNPGSYWSICILLDAISVATLDNVRCQGYQNGINFYGTGLQIQNSQAQHATDYRLSNCFFWQVNIGITISAGVEGFLASDLEIAGANIGLQWINGAGQQVPLLDLSGGHINSAQYGILTNGVAQVFINNYDIYRYVNNGIGKDWCGINIANSATAGASEKIQISNVDIFGFPTTNATACNGIALDNVTDAEIAFDGIDSCDTGIWLKPGTRNCVIYTGGKDASGNYKLITNCHTPILDQGQGNIIL